jgi:hypothetical protein
MVDHTAAGSELLQRDQQVKKLLEDLNKITKESLGNIDSLAPDLPASKAQAVYSFLEGHQQKLDVLLKIFNAADQRAALQREKASNDWLKAATTVDLVRLSMEMAMKGMQGNLSFVTAVVAKEMPEAAKALAIASDNIGKCAGAPLAAIGIVTDTIRLIDAIQRKDKAAIVRSVGGITTGAVQATFYLTADGGATLATARGATRAAAGGGAGAAMVIYLWVEGIVAIGRLGGTLGQIRIEKERRGLWNIVQRAAQVAGIARGMFANCEAYQQVLSRDSADAAFLWTVIDAEGRLLADNMISLARKLEADDRLSRETFPQGLLTRVYSGTAIKNGMTMSGKKELVQHLLKSTAAYVALRLYELKVIPQHAIPNEMMDITMQWKI